MDTQNVNWGKVIKGAAIAAGAVAVVALVPGVGSTISSVADAVFGGFGSVGEWIASKIGSIVGYIGNNATASIATAAGAGALAGAAITPIEDKNMTNLENESFAMREDMRRMQALMQARMAATGYQPAMAMAGRGR